MDATGEPAWPYGAEDIAGDGLGVFSRNEQTRDLRTAYAATGNSRLFVRLYVSDPAAPAPDLLAFLFVDADHNPLTGGPADRDELQPALTDSNAGGYEYVVSFHGDGTLGDLFTWQPASNSYSSNALNNAEASGETGSDDDPIGIYGRQRGYLQLSVRLDLIGISDLCDADLYLRTVNPNDAAGGQDSDVGHPAACIPADTNRDRIPDVIVVDGCRGDEFCPSGSICVGARCVFTPACFDDSQCAPDDTCAPNGFCVARPSGSCNTNATCGSLVCIAGRCSACTSNDQCSTGQRCAPSGRCVDNQGSNQTPTSLAEGEKVEGGAFNCAVSVGRNAATGVGAFASLLLLSLLRRRFRA